ncbi:MAG: hypothetical protein GY950_33485 [bacterium]|nr:hypothetical protein [bacterium]
MGNREDYEKKLDVLTAIGDDQIKTPHHIPVSMYAGEAKTLYHQARKDKEAFIAAGFPWELVEDLPIRTGALIEAEALWYVQLKTRKESAARWSEESALAYDLKKQLLNTFDYAFREHPGLLGTLKYIKKGRGHSDMIQALNDLSVLGKKNAALLEAVRFDMVLLDKAAQTSDHMAELLAEANSDKLAVQEVKKIRDQAYTHLKEAMDEVCKCGQFLYRYDRERMRAYRSEHLRKKNLKRRSESKTKKEN